DDLTDRQVDVGAVRGRRSTANHERLLTLEGKDAVLESLIPIGSSRAQPFACWALVAVARMRSSTGRLRRSSCARTASAECLTGSPGIGTSASPRERRGRGLGSTAEQRGSERRAQIGSSGATSRRCESFDPPVYGDRISKPTRTTSQGSRACTPQYDATKA